MLINLSDLSKIYLIWLLGIILIFLVAIFWKYSETDISVGIIKTLESWDGGYFINISENGYTQNYQFVFLPLFPYLLRIINSIVLVNGVFVAFFVNTLLLLGFIRIFYFLLKKDYDQKTSIKIISLFLLYPYSFYLVLPYAESLFLFLTGLVFFYLFRDKIWITFVFLLLAIFTRISGFFLFPVIFFEIIISKKHRKYMVLIPILFITAFFYYFYINTGSFLINFEAETVYWKRSLGFPGMGLLSGIREVILEPNNISNLLNILSVIFGVGLFIRSIRVLRKEYVIYMATGLLFYLSLSSLVSFPRFVMILFPIYIALGLIKNRIFIWSYIILSICVTIINIFLFVNGKFVS